MNYYAEHNCTISFRPLNLFIFQLNTTKCLKYVKLNSVMKSCIIVGAGISGLICAYVLKENGFGVTVIDKARGVGGRMATRRIRSTGDNNRQGVYDHGAQYITVRDARFERYMKKWVSGGLVREWCRGFPSAENSSKLDGHPRYSGLYGMTTLPKHLSENLEIRLNQRVSKISSSGHSWEVITEYGDLYSADSLVLTAPVPQSLHMIDNGKFELDEKIRKELEVISYHPCIVVLAELNGPSAIPAPGGMNLEDPVISWIADNKQKGISPDAVTLTIHTTPEFTYENWKSDDKKISDIVIHRANEYLGSEVVRLQVHRWRYSLPVEAAENTYLVANLKPPLLFIGDAFGGGRVEGAFISGVEGTTRLINILE